MTNSLVRSNSDADNDAFFSPRGPMDENHQHPNHDWPLVRDSHYKLKLLQQQLLQQQSEVVVSSSSSSSMHDDYLHSSIHDDNAACSSSSSAAMASSSYSSPLMVLAAAAAATETMDPSSYQSLLDCSPITTQQGTNRSDPTNNKERIMTAGMRASNGGTATTPFCKTHFANERTPMSLTSSSSSPYIPNLRYGTTHSPMTSSVSACRLACLAAVSSHARDAAAAAATDTPGRRRTESMLLDEQKCLLAMSTVPPYAHPLFASTRTTKTEVRVQPVTVMGFDAHRD
jgi:hypothetical protein